MSVSRFSKMASQNEPVMRAYLCPDLPGLGIGAGGRRISGLVAMARWVAYPVALIALPPIVLTGLDDASTDLARLPGRVTCILCVFPHRPSQPLKNAKQVNECWGSTLARDSPAIPRPGLPQWAGLAPVSTSERKRPRTDPGP